MTKNYRFEIFSFLFHHAGGCADISPLLDEITQEAGYSPAYLVILLKALRSNGLINFDESISNACITPDGITEYNRLKSHYAA